MSHLDRRAFLQAGAVGAAAALAASNCQAVEGDASAKSLGKTPHTLFAVNLEMWWTDLPFLQRVEKAIEFGYPAIEFWPYQNKDLDKIIALSQANNLVIAQFSAWGFEPGMNNPKNEDAFIKAIEESCQIAHRLNCEKMCVVAGNNQPGMTQEQMLAQVVKALRRAAPIAEREKVMLILEPMNGRVDHPGHCLYGSEDAVRICREVNSPYVKVLWDLYHMQIAEGDLCGHLRDGYDQLGYVQLADHPGRNEPGTGEIYYNRVLREVYELGYRGYVGLELRPKTTALEAARGVAAADVW
jgi:hydroxypyruvate isomerase